MRRCEELPAELSARVEKAQAVLISTDRAKIEAAWRDWRDIAERYPNGLEVQSLVAQLAFRIGQWADAEDFRRSGPIDESRPDLLFYQAVALYELGRLEEAALVLNRSLPRLEKTPYVRSYAERIIGNSDQ